MPVETVASADADARTELLLHMYDQAWNNINRHVLVVWQSVGVLVAALAVYSAVGKALLSLDVATTIIVIVAAWLLGNVYDAAEWYNRNNAIIANVEKELLLAADKKINPFIGVHRKPGSVLQHLRVQGGFGIAVWLFAVLNHFVANVIPSLHFHAPIAPGKWFPYVFSAIAIPLVVWIAVRANRGFSRFLSELEAVNEKPV